VENTDHTGTKAKNPQTPAERPHIHYEFSLEPIILIMGRTDFSDVIERNRKLSFFELSRKSDSCEFVTLEAGEKAFCCRSTVMQLRETVPLSRLM
jgi:hypothetical protein